MKYERIKKLTKLILDIMFFTGIIVLITLPIWLRFAGTHYSKDIENHYLAMVIVFAVSGLNGLLIVNELRKMMKTVLEVNCFVEDNVKSLRRMARYSLVISIFFFIKVLLVPTPATLIIILVFFIAALFSVVLSCVFQEAVNYKDENDLTI
ncbi:DUF2975 domain-containing protein [Coprococcus catus]|uniref:DUF2975 domain-containing protein n=1 Tax=Lachnospiraceae TaxID=186803 RepID=UPI002A7E6D15|nr:DUF2975 domain-containing protein [bacterium]MDY2884338.1 DUF2975 domain-containing protein [Bariatricus sp.]